MGTTTPRIFHNVEEGLARAIRRITFHDPITKDRTVLKDTFDPFTGEVIQAPITPKFYDSSADANHIQDPNFFIRLMKTREDRFTGRVVPEYGQWIAQPVQNSPGAYQIILNGIDGIINPAGNNLVTTAFQIRKIQPGYLLRLLSGNNIGTYYVASITPADNGNHTITVSSSIVQNLPVSIFDPNTRIVYFQGGVDLATVQVGDVYTDASSASFNITAVDPNMGTITIDGNTTPSLLVNSTITRTGNVFKNVDLSSVRYLVMDPSQPVQVAGVFGKVDQKAETVGVSPPIPIDAYYLIRIDSKTRQNHIDVLNRVWEEFNPPRTALPVIQRSSLSAEQFLTANVSLGGSNTLQVKDSSKFSIGDPVVVIDQFHPTSLQSGAGYERPFSSKVTAIPSPTSIQLEDTVPDSFTTANFSKIISNTEFQLFMFHFVDHVTKDVEGSQYWVHEFTFWVQIWVDRLETPGTVGPVTEISTPIEDLQGNVIIEDE